MEPSVQVDDSETESETEPESEPDLYQGGEIIPVRFYT
jgi:hypothetical protein